MSNHFQSMTHSTLQMEKTKILPLFTLLKNCIYGDCINLQLHVLTNYVTTRLQHWKTISCTWVLGKFQGYGGFWTYFGQLYNFGQCALTLCFNCFVVVICNSSTQMQWCGLHSPSRTNTSNVANSNWHGHHHAICMVFVITPCAITLQLWWDYIVIKYEFSFLTSWFLTHNTK
jgi:hypothetical protein